MGIGGIDRGPSPQFGMQPEMRSRAFRSRKERGVLFSISVGKRRRHMVVVVDVGDRSGFRNRSRRLRPLLHILAGATEVFTGVATLMQAMRGGRPWGLLLFRCTQSPRSSAPGHPILQDQETVEDIPRNPFHHEADCHSYLQLFTPVMSSFQWHSFAMCLRPVRRLLCTKYCH